MIYKIDLHCHSDKYSGCSHVSIEELCRLNIERGLDAICITDHSYCWDYNELEYINNKFFPFKIFSGMELTINTKIPDSLYRFDYCNDVVVIGEPEILRNYNNKKMSVIDFYKMMNKHSDKLFSFVAHPFRWNDDPDSHLYELLDRCDGVEANSYNIINIKPNHYLRTSKEFTYKTIFNTEVNKYMPVCQVENLKCINKFPNLKFVYNTDCHNSTSAGVIYNILEIENKPNDINELINILKTADIKEGQNLTMLDEIFKPNYNND